MTRLLTIWLAIPTPYASGVNALPSMDATDCWTCLGPGDPGLFPPLQSAAIIALLCEHLAQQPSNGNASAASAADTTLSPTTPATPTEEDAASNLSGETLGAPPPPSAPQADVPPTAPDVPLLPKTSAAPAPPPQASAVVGQTNAPPACPADPLPTAATGQDQTATSRVQAERTRTQPRPSAVRKPYRRRILPLDDLHELVLSNFDFPCPRTTLWRLLQEHALRPWTYRHWIFPRDPKFLQKAGPVLDLYQGIWQGLRLGPDEYVLSIDEKTSIQARLRLYPTVGAKVGQPAKLEFEYLRMGALQYLAAWDVLRGQVIGRCEARTGIASFNRLLEQVLQQEPYRSAKRIFVIVDNGSSHRGEASIRRTQELFPQVVLVHLPVHASWLNQVEIYFSIIQRVLLQPNDFPNLEAVAESLLEFEKKYNAEAQPLAWRFQRADLEELVKKLQRYPLPKKATKKSRKTKAGTAKATTKAGKAEAVPVCQ
jgi:hypothetical protein